MLYSRAVGAATCVIVFAVGGTAAASNADQATQSPPAPKEIQVSDSRLQFYGFFREDVIIDDSRPDSFQSPLFILSEPAGAVDRENFTMHPRLTRFGLNLLGPSITSLGGTISAKLEVDFQNGGRESRAIPRWRHAYMNVEWRAAALLVGQTWDLISPLFPNVNADTLMWNAGNVGDRRPQIRFTVQPPSQRLQWSLAAAAGLGGAVDPQDLDNDTVRDAEAAALPNLQVRLGISRPIGTRRLSAGFWSYVAQQQVATPVAGETAFNSHLFGVDAELPLGRRAIIRGEVWTGRNLSDVRGGIGQAINRTTGDGIRSTGGWLEVGGDVTAGWAAFVGYTVDAPDANDLPAGGRTRNDAWFLVNRWSGFRPLGIGIDYLRWTTEYKQLPTGRDNRINAYFVYNF